MLTLNEDRRDILKYFVAAKVGRMAWMVPPRGLPENVIPIDSRAPRVVSNGLSRESKAYDGPTDDEV